MPLISSSDEMESPKATNPPANSNLDIMEVSESPITTPQNNAEKNKTTKRKGKNSTPRRNPKKLKKDFKPYEIPNRQNRAFYWNHVEIKQDNTDYFACKVLDCNYFTIRDTSSRDRLRNHFSLKHSGLDPKMQVMKCKIDNQLRGLPGKRKNRLF